jgi:hypothetical protein
MRGRYFLLLTILLGVASLGVTVFLVRRGVKEREAPTVTKAAETNPDKCQGNYGAAAKCFDCKKDAAASSQVNMLDYSCFTQFYGKNVGKP